MKTVRLGIVGLGAMGSDHGTKIVEGKVPNTTLAAVCDEVADLSHFPNAKPFRNSREMIRSGEIDAILIATPHFAHTTVGIDALENGLHVLVEKPISVHKADAERLIAAWEAAGRKPVFAAMFDTRTVPVYRKLHQLIRGKENGLGRIRRVTWIVTTWFRTQHYYDLGAWRGTWRGEGGGILVNQCPHNLDLFQWLFGMPQSIQAICRIGKYHKIEVEDEFHALLDFADGCVATIIASTGEAPGSSRFEIAGENGLAVVENDRILFTRNETPMSEFCMTSKERMKRPESWDAVIPAGGRAGGHTEIMSNFVDCILNGTPLIAPAQEGVRSIELANAILYSSFKRRPIDLPLDSKVYAQFLKEKIDSSLLPAG
jgi:predicted dehydrogenase